MSFSSLPVGNCNVYTLIYGCWLCLWYFKLFSSHNNILFITKSMFYLNLQYKYILYTCIYNISWKNQLNSNDNIIQPLYESSPFILMHQTPVHSLTISSIFIIVTLMYQTPIHSFSCRKLLFIQYHLQTSTIFSIHVHIANLNPFLCNSIQL